MRVALVVLLLIAVDACSHAPRGTAKDRNVIRSDEIATVQAANAYDIVAKLRGEFLRSRGPITTSRDVTQNPTITVFVDGVQAGPVERTLQYIPANEVREIRFYKATDAVTKYGSRYNGGVIDVLTIRTLRE